MDYNAESSSNDIAGCKTTKSSLSMDGEYLSLAVKLAHLGPWKYDPTTNLFEFCDEFYAIYGTSTAREGRFMSPDAYTSQFVHPDDASMVQAEIDKALSSPERHYSFRMEHRIIRRDGEVRIIVVLANIIKDEFGKVLKYYGADQDITERIAAEEKIKRQNGYLTSLHEISIGLLNRLDVDDLLKTIVNHACALFGSPDGFVAVVAEDRNVLEYKVGGGRFAKHMATFAVGEGVIGRVRQTGKPLVIENYSNWIGRKKDSFYDNVKTSIGIPIKSGEKVIGVVGLDFFDVPRAVSEEDVSFFSRFAELASIAIDNARLYTALQGELEGRKRALSDLAASEEKFYKAFRHVGDVVGLVRLDDGCYIEVNDAFSKVLGYSREEIIGRTSTEIGLWADRDSYRNFYELVNSTGAVNRLEVSWRSKAGKVLVGMNSAEVIDIGGKRYIVYVWHDITERKQTEEKLRYLSKHDTLTGLYNRAHFREELERFQNEGHNPIAVIMGDIDGLKLVNDTLGHIAGDQLLVTAAELIGSGLRPDDISARIGGDEFAIIIPGANEDTVQAIMGKIRDEIIAYNQTNPYIPVSMSLGYSVKNDNTRSMREVLRDADNNMYREKLYHSQSAHSTIAHSAVKLLEERGGCGADTKKLQDLAEKLALALDLPPSRIADVRLLAKYHDIGKIGIPDSVLFKSGTLTEEEKQKVRRHCEIGYRIAQSATDLLPIASLILKHQEWWNGEGYPLGISGEEIPLECRIVAIVDAYEAMTRSRVYGRVLTYNEALEELKQCAGIQFDPHLVNLFVQLISGKVS